ncbi:MAG: DUF99 family protein [Thermoplasmata archaeon]|nr:MAG: DUF99 family protein [Thermoplasmata archaeon]
MKPQIRVLAVDDSPFKFGDERVLVIGVVMRVPAYMEAVLRTEVAVDGKDACERLAEMINTSRYKEQLRLVLIDGVALGGFNVVDIRELHEKIGLPVATVTRERPDFPAMEEALREHFEDWERRLNIIKEGELVSLETEHKPIFMKFIGIELEELKEVIEQSTVRGALPEALRVAHLIATGVVAGESRGMA